MCEPPLFAVADGMGGAQAGELASRTRGRRARGARRRAAGRGGRRGGRAGRERPHLPPLAGRSRPPPGWERRSTVALLDEDAGTITIGHVGDSRAYRVRDGRLEQLTDDHSLVAELVRSGRLTQEEADQHPHRSVITRALGTEQAVEVDTRTVDDRARRPLPDLLRRADDHGRATRRSSTSSRGADGDLDAAAESLVAAANARRRRGQHHRRARSRSTRGDPDGGRRTRRRATPRRRRRPPARRAARSSRRRRRRARSRRTGAPAGGRAARVAPHRRLAACSRRSSSTSASCDERTQRELLNLAVRRRRRLGGVCERLDRRLGRPCPGLGRAGRSASRAASTSSRTSSCARTAPARRPDAAPARRPPHRGRADGDLPPRPRRRAEAARLGRRSASASRAW